MLTAILGKKIKQTQKFTEDGKCVPVTQIQTGPCMITQIKTLEKDHYEAVQLGFGAKAKTGKALLGHLGKSLKGKDEGKRNPPRFLREIRLDEVKIKREENGDPKIGDYVKIDNVFEIGDKVDVTGTSKGKGFAGGVKRYHFHGGPKTHGQSDRHRAPGSIGQTTTPGRVYKGKRMAGHMGNARVTIKNLVILDIDKENDILLVKGLVPGPRNGLLKIRKTRTKSSQ